MLKGLVGAVPHVQPLSDPAAMWGPGKYNHHQNRQPVPQTLVYFNRVLAVEELKFGLRSTSKPQRMLTGPGT